MRSKYPTIRRPATLPKPPRYILRAELSTGEVEVVATGHLLSDEIGVAKSYHARTGRKVWLIDGHTGRTVHRIERKGLAAGGGR